MQDELANHMLACATAYAAACDNALTTLGRKAAGSDTNFFLRLAEREGTFTVEKYDSVMGWFSENWPQGVRWPKGIRRPRIGASG